MSATADHDEERGGAPRAHRGLPIEYRPAFGPRAGAAASPEKASVEIARRIVDDVLAQGLGVGDRLPSEAEMVASYGASRESLREGLRLLEVQGLLSIRRGPGGGPRVSPVNAAYLARSASLFFHVAGATYREVFEAWLELEPVLVAKVAAHPDRRTVVAAMAPYRHSRRSTDPREVFDASASFHAEVGRLSGNRVLVLLLQSVNHVLTELMMEAIDLGAAGEVIDHDHRELATAIARGHTRRAEQIARQHIRGLEAEFLAVAGSRIDDVVDWR